MKRIIFLDIDGVMNSSATALKYGFGGWFQETDVATRHNVLWGQDLVHNLKYIVEQTGAEIVISSTWRLSFSVDKFKEMFAIYYWPDAPVIDKTVELKNRGLEVNEWLSRHQVSSYVILDDNNWFLTEQQTRFVQTSIDDGLTLDHAKRAVEILSQDLLLG